MIESSCFVMYFLFIFIVLAEEFDYEHQAKWYDQFHECSMNRQSPIELSSNDAELSYEIAALSFAHYDVAYASPATCENNGHTANVQLPRSEGYSASLWKMYDKRSPHVTGGPLPKARFIAESVHFHWGSEDAHGSEHVIDSERYSMECHLLHRNTKYETVEEAREHQDGLAVLAVLYSVNVSLSEGFAGLDHIISALENITQFHKTARIDNFTLSTLFGSLELAEFYTYEGSLTTPPCSQAVTWIVFSHAIPISHAQMQRFHALSDGHGALLENNYRALQAKGNRRVYLRNKRKVIDSVIESPVFWDIFRNLAMDAASLNENVTTVRSV